LQRGTICCNAARPVATRHDLLQRGTTCCNAARPVATRHDRLQRGKTGCNAARPVATRQDRLQRGRTGCNAARPAQAVKGRARELVITAVSSEISATFLVDISCALAEHFMPVRHLLRVAWLTPRFLSCGRYAAPLSASLGRLLHA
jgi:hypothetical protein